MDKWHYFQRHSLQKAWTSGATFKSIHCKGHEQVAQIVLQNEGNAVSTIAFAS